MIASLTLTTFMNVKLMDNITLLTTAVAGRKTHNSESLVIVSDRERQMLHTNSKYLIRQDSFLTQYLTVSMKRRLE